MRDRTGRCCCLALYDWPIEVDRRAWFQSAMRFFDEVGAHPDTGSLGSASREAVDFGEVRGRIERSELEHDAAVSIYSTVTGYTQLMLGWTVMASLTSSPNKNALFCFECDSASALSVFADLVPIIVDALRPRYGIGYDREFRKGPDMYAYGMVAGLGYSSQDMAEADEIGAWMRERLDANRHLDGWLRDVYPLNILSSCHVSRPMGGASLKEWIDGSSDKGELLSVGEELWLWKVPANHLSEVRAALRQAGYTIVSGHRWY